MLLENVPETAFFMLFYTRAGDYMVRAYKELPVDYKICSSPEIVF
jgi:hypothetical protein